MSWKPTGRPSLSPQGILIAGRPARFTGIVQMSHRYIESGSAVREPTRKATVGDVGETIRSTLGEGPLEVAAHERAHLLRLP